MSRIVRLDKTYKESYAKNLQIAIDREKELAKREAQVQLKEWVQKSEKLIREDAVKRSRSSVVGKITEHLIPYFGGATFPYNPKDCRFLGTPADIIVFNGMDEGNISEIIFAEIKTGEHAQLTLRERQVRDAIKEGKVKWKLIRVERNDSDIDEDPQT